MVKIVIVVKPDCQACTIVKKVISEAVNKINLDSIVAIKHTNTFIKDAYNVDIYPTTIFYRECKTIEEKAVYGVYKEIARLEGSFPIDYLNKVIDKLKLECNE